ncbi:MAG: alpha/beta hydrolase family protein [Arcicella sp.]|nr:alpha/beta hydrolase family protein [Arcicella sp.]
MKKQFSFLITLLIFTSTAFAQNMGKVMEGKMVKSAILSKDVKYTIYLPADYEKSERNYPVVYLLHGYTDDDTGWLQFGEINRLVDKAISDGTIPPMIIVMPDGGVSFYMNSYDGKEKYEDFFVKEFMPTIEKTYKIKAKKQFRGIAGLSMGGFGSLNYALKYPDMFTAVAPLSAAIWDDTTIEVFPKENYDRTLGQLFGRDLVGKDRLTKSWHENSALKMVETKSAEDLKKVRYWIDCGDDDFLTKGNSLFHIAMTDKKVPHEFRMREGGHTWDYWRSGIIPALEFIGKSFHQ